MAKESLDARPKVMVMIPLEKGEKSGKAFHPFTINGYRISYPKGEMIEVPDVIAEMIKERFFKPAQGSEKLIGRSGEVQEALS